ncbi:MAG: hypothetical protein ACRDFZ_08650, partial [Candidatus Limnocylindria bacterium]
AIGLGAAAVVRVLLIGSNLLDSASPAPGGQPTASVAPTEAERSVEPSSAAGLPVHLLWLEPVRIDVTIPAPGWYGEPANGILVKNDDPDPPDGAGLIVFEGPMYVYGDPCQWSTTKPDTPATTVDELVAALSAQASRDATAPVDVTVGGFTGKSITLHVPDDAVFSDCDQGYFGTLVDSLEPTPSRYHQGPGQIDELWILDVNGVLVIIDTAYYAGTPAADVEELRAIVESATFQSP